MENNDLAKLSWKGPWNCVRKNHYTCDIKMKALNGGCGKKTIGLMTSHTFWHVLG